MTSSSSRTLLAAASLALAATAHAQYTALQTGLFQFYASTREYNLITINDFTRPSGGQDTLGPVAIGGNATLGGSFSFANSAAPTNSTRSSASDPSLIIAGTFSLNGSSSLNLGQAAVNQGSNPNLFWDSGQGRLTQTGNTSNYLFVQTAPRSSPFTNFFTNLPPGWSFSALDTKFRTISDSLKAYSTNQNLTGTGISGNSLSQGVAANSIGILNLTQGQLNGLAQVDINVPASSVLLINVLGAAGGTFPSLNMIGSTSGSQNRILWNFLGTPAGQAEPASFTYTFASASDFFGSVLAPRADMTANRVLDGQIVARSFIQGSVEVHDALFSPPPSLVPEPRSWSLAAALGALVAVFAARRSRR